MRERSQRFDPRQNMHLQTFEVFHYKEAKPGDVQVHHHDFYEIYFFLNGKAEYWVDGRLYTLKPGDLLLINPMELHRPLAISGNTYERIVLWINRDYIQDIADGITDLTECFSRSVPLHTNLLQPTAAQRSELVARFGELVRESYSKEYGSGLYADGIFLQLMVEINRMAKRKNAQWQEGEKSSNLVKKVLEYIAEHFREPLSLQELAQMFYVSKYHLSHEFSREVGTSVYRYIMLKRLLHARQMLSDGAAPGEVFSSCGFTDYANFYRAFKAEYGVSPKDCSGS